MIQKASIILLLLSFQATAETVSTVKKEVLENINLDFQSAVNGSVIPGIGESMKWANGTLTRTKKGELRYVNTNNGYYAATLDANSDITKLATENGDIKNMWIAQYGVDLAGVNDQANQEGYKNQIAHIVGGSGLSASYNKENPWMFGNGIGAYSENGKVVLFTNKGPISYKDLLETNEYKALTGGNVEHAVSAAAAPAVSTVAANSGKGKNRVRNNVGNMDYVCMAKDSAMEMLVKAARQFRTKQITAEKFNEIALSVSDMGAFNNKVSGDVDKQVTNATGAASKPAGLEDLKDSEIKSCEQNPKFAMCRPAAERLPYLQQQFANAKKPMTQEFVNSFGPGFENSEKAFADWSRTSKSFVASCDEALNYGLFAGEKNKSGAWKADSNRKFYDNGKLMGEGGAYITIRQYVDKSGAPMIAAEVSFDAVGYCHK